MTPRALGVGLVLAAAVILGILGITEIAAQMALR